MLELGLKALIAYLLGSLMGALLVGALRGVDIREQGSGNAGGTNAWRTQGIGFAAATAAIDVGKGWLAAAWLPAWVIPGMATDPAIDRDWLEVTCAGAAVAGHVWPQFFGFRGGKGGATLVGVLLAIAPPAVPVAIGAWLVVMMLCGFVSLATMTAAAVVPAALRLLDLHTEPLMTWALVMTAFIVWTHRSNIGRMRSGSEPRLERLWLMRPRKRGP